MIKNRDKIVNRDISKIKKKNVFAISPTPIAEGDQTHHPAQSIQPHPPTPGPRLCPCNAILPLPLRRPVHATDVK